MNPQVLLEFSCSRGQNSLLKTVVAFPLLSCKSLVGGGGWNRATVDIITRASTVHLDKAIRTANGPEKMWPGLVWGRMSSSYTHIIVCTEL